jgi:pyrimidine deaminase RibD-like protein
MNEYISSLIRHGLTSVGGSLVAKGVITTTMFDEVVGAIVVLAGVIWSVASKSILKKLHGEQIAVALMTPPPTKEESK